MRCKYCNASDFGGEIFYGANNQQYKVCWREDCKGQHRQERSRIDYRDKMKLKMAGKCFFEDTFGFCQAPIVKGETLCATHLEKRCAMCGFQATRVCKFQGWEVCTTVFCDRHKHHHAGYP